MTSTDSIILQDYGMTRIAWHGAWHSTMWSEYAVPQVHSCPRHDWMRLRERLRALLEAASPRFKTRLSTDWNKTRNLAGIIRSANSQPAGRTVLGRKTTFLQSKRLRPRSPVAPWFPHMAAVSVCSYPASASLKLANRHSGIRG